MALGGVIIRFMVAVGVPVIRAFGVAFQQALINAKKGGVDAEEEEFFSGGGGEVSSSTSSLPFLRRSAFCTRKF